MLRKSLDVLKVMLSNSVKGLLNRLTLCCDHMVECAVDVLRDRYAHVPDMKAFSRCDAKCEALQGVSKIDFGAESGGYDVSLRVAATR